MQYIHPPQTRGAFQYFLLITCPEPGRNAAKRVVRVILSVVADSTGVL